MKKPLKPCKKLNCIELTRESYCQQHKPIKQEESNNKNKRYNQTREKKYTSFYNSKEWKQTRLLSLIQHNYLCQDCKAEGKTNKADVVDHIIELKDNYSLRLTLSNLKPLCHYHHNKKTAIEKKKREQKETNHILDRL